MGSANWRTQEEKTDGLALDAVVQGDFSAGADHARNLKKVAGDEEIISRLSHAAGAEGAPAETTTRQLRR